MRQRLLSCLLLTILVFAGSASAQQKWLTLPPTPVLPETANSGFIISSGVKLWYAVFGEETKPTVTLLHGGGGSSDYWAHLVKALADEYRVIVIDARGHGRSEFGGRPYSYDAMANDIIAALDHLKVGKTAIVGWSDGAIIGFYLTLKHPDRFTGHYAFAGNTHLGGMKSAPAKSAFSVYAARVIGERMRLFPAGKDAQQVRAALGVMYRSQPNFTRAELKKITTPTAVVHAEHDEIITAAHAKEIVASLPHAKLVILPQLSHFALLQDPQQFNNSVKEFLKSLR